MTFLYLTEENCLYEFKKFNCSDLGNRDSVVCKYYR